MQLYLIKYPNKKLYLSPRHLYTTMAELYELILEKNTTGIVVEDYVTKKDITEQVLQRLFKHSPNTTKELLVKLKYTTKYIGDEKLTNNYTGRILRVTLNAYNKIINTETFKHYSNIEELHRDLKFLCGGY